VAGGGGGAGAEVSPEVAPVQGRRLGGLESVPGRLMVSAWNLTAISPSPSQRQQPAQKRRKYPERVKSSRELSGRTPSTPQQKLKQMIQCSSGSESAPPECPSTMLKRRTKMKRASLSPTSEVRSLGPANTVDDLAAPAPATVWKMPEYSDCCWHRH